eukprot:2164005-Pyramimonas_sp.AAC.1
MQETRLLASGVASPASWALKAGFNMHAGAAFPTGDGALEHSGGVAVLAQSRFGAKPMGNLFSAAHRHRFAASLVSITDAMQ